MGYSWSKKEMIRVKEKKNVHVRMPLYLSGAPLVSFVSHLNVTTDIAGGAGLFMFMIGADDVELEPFVVSVKLFVCISVRRCEEILRKFINKMMEKKNLLGGW